MTDGNGRTIDEGDCYWVKFSPNDDWQVAEWNKVYGWFWIGCESAQRVVFDIGPHIMPPITCRQDGD